MNHKKSLLSDSLQTGLSFVVAKGEGCERGMDWEFGINRCKIVYTEWVNIKVLLHSTGNYIQYLQVNHNGKEYKKEHMCLFIYVCVCVTESLCCKQKLTRCCKLTVLQ